MLKPQLEIPRCLCYLTQTEDTIQHRHPEKQIQNCLSTLAKDGRRQEQKRHFLDSGMCTVGIMRFSGWIAAL